MKTVADTFDVSRSNLIERLKGVRARAASYGKQDDEWLLPMIRELVDAHPTYGYRRITALLNRRFRTNGEPLVNHKRVYRIMASSHLLLQSAIEFAILTLEDGVATLERLGIGLRDGTLASRVDVEVTTIAAGAPRR